MNGTELTSRNHERQWTALWQGLDLAKGPPEVSKRNLRQETFGRAYGGVWRPAPRSRLEQFAAWFNSSGDQATLGGLAVYVGVPPSGGPFPSAA